MSGKIAVLNFTSPNNKPVNVDAAKFNAAKAAFVSVAPSASPGMKIADLQSKAKVLLPQDLFPGGATSGWWFKCVQLDMEARGEMKRSATAPLHLWLTNLET
jgi:hypothetical protein